MIDKCGSTLEGQALHPLDVKMYTNGALSPGFRVNRLAAGLDYEVRGQPLVFKWEKISHCVFGWVFRGPNKNKTNCFYPPCRSCSHLETKWWPV